MARNEARIFTRIWQNPDFVVLSTEAQRMFVLVLSQPNLSFCGVLPYTPKRWAKLAKGSTPKKVVQAVAELADAGFVVVDVETEELMVRSFVKHDGVFVSKNTNMAKAARRDFELIASDVIRRLFLEGVPEDVNDALVKENGEPFPDPLDYPLPEGMPNSCLLSPAPNSKPRPASSGPDPAAILLRSFFEEANPKPAQPWPAMLGVVRKMLAAGWSEDDLRWALRDAPTVSTGALTLSLNRRRGGNGKANTAMGFVQRMAARGAS